MEKTCGTENTITSQHMKSWSELESWSVSGRFRGTPTKLSPVRSGHPIGEGLSFCSSRRRGGLGGRRTIAGLGGGERAKGLSWLGSETLVRTRLGMSTHALNRKTSKTSRRKSELWRGSSPGRPSGRLAANAGSRVAAATITQRQRQLSRPKEGSAAPRWPLITTELTLERPQGGPASASAAGDMRPDLL